MKWNFIFTASLFVSSLAYANVQNESSACCQPIKTCTVQTDSGGSSACGAFYLVEQTILDCSGRQIRKAVLAQQLCQHDANQLLASAACN